MDGSRYWIVMFDTETGGGIAFVTAIKSREEAEQQVIANIHYDWQAIEAKVIGLTTELTVDDLYQKEGIYHYGGDSNI